MSRHERLLVNHDAEVLNALVRSFAFIVPEAVLVAAACVLFLGGTFRANRHLWAGCALVSLVVAALFLFDVPRNLQASAGWRIAFSSDVEPGATPTAAQAMIYASPLFFDKLALLIKAMAIVGGAILVMLSWNQVPDRQAAEYHACLLVIVAGLCLTGAANDLITLFLALELISIPTYVLLYLPRHDSAAQEAATKYFLLSVFSSAFLLLGFSYLYGLSGTTNLPAILDALNQRQSEALRTTMPPPPALAVAALVMVVVGLGFKITAVPFHFYAPDVYQGTPTIAAALLAFIPKVAGFAALVRILGFAWPGRGDVSLAFGGQMPILFWILAAVTMTLGNILALLQSNIKRLLAYSSVAHAGYMLIGITVAQNLDEPTGVRLDSLAIPGGVAAILFYLIAYGAMTIGAFAVLAYLSTPQRPVETEDDLTGLAGSHPGIALLMALFLFSLMGMPLTAGFVGKALLFLGALRVGAPLFLWLAVVAAINAAIGAWYYLRIVARMYLHTSIRPLEQTTAWPGLATLWICAALTLALGIYPNPLVQALAAIP